MKIAEVITLLVNSLVIIERWCYCHDLAHRHDADDANRAPRSVTRPRACVARACQLIALTMVLMIVSPAYATGPVPVPAGARAAALDYKPRWIEAANRNPVFYHVQIGMDLNKLEILDGFANVMLIDADVVRFAQSGEEDPVRFATRLFFEFPMLVEGVYVGNLIIQPRPTAGADTLAAYVRTGTRNPGGGLDPVVERVGGYSRSREFSVVSFVGESFAGVFLRLANDGGVQFVPVNPEAEALFSGEEIAAPLPADRAVPLIRTRILERARIPEKTRK